MTTTSTDWDTRTRMPNTYSRFLTLHEVEHLTSLRKSTLYAMMKAGAFPRQTKITARRSAWLASDVQAWIEAKVAGVGLGS